MKQWKLDNLNKLNKFFEEIFEKIGIDFEIKEGNRFFIENIAGKGFSIQVRYLYNRFENYEESESNFYGFALYYVLLDENGESIEKVSYSPRVLPTYNTIDLRKEYTYEQKTVTKILSYLLEGKYAMGENMNEYSQILNIELPKEKLTDEGLSHVYSLIMKNL